ncbi:MAG: hypothetical protein MZV70_33565 [Desulfobacterales bacterium]|nr:hypothetical protein [Desulfobacterales bacterium]
MGPQWPVTRASHSQGCEVLRGLYACALNGVEVLGVAERFESVRPGVVAPGGPWLFRTSPGRGASRSESPVVVNARSSTSSLL